MNIAAWLHLKSKWNRHLIVITPDRLHCQSYVPHKTSKSILQTLSIICASNNKYIHLTNIVNHIITSLWPDYSSAQQHLWQVMFMLPLIAKSPKYSHMQNILIFLKLQIHKLFNTQKLPLIQCILIFFLIFHGQFWPSL